MAHQYREQLPPDIRAGVDANARNKIVFGLEITDAKALFDKILVCPNDDGSCGVRPQFAEPYGFIFGQEAPEAAVASKAGDMVEEGLEIENPANLRGIGELSRQFAEWRNRRIFLGGGFSNRLL